jgi:hypothetical protein
MDFTLDELQTTTTRVVLNIQDVLSSVGGIQTIILSIAMFLSSGI